MANLADKVVEKHERMRGNRFNWDSHWDEVAEYIIPRKNDIFGTAVRGEKKHNKLFTSVSVQANETLASALHGMLTNPATTWFGLNTGIKELDELDEVKSWIEGAVQKMIDVFNNSNFQTEIHQVYLDLGSFGTGLMRIEEDTEMTVRFQSRPIYEAFLDENYKGIVDTISYEYEMSIRQLVQQFGEDILTLNSDLYQKFNTDPMCKLTVIHLVQPREDFDPSKKKPSELPYASIHVLKEARIVLEEKGFHENPYITPRWTKLSGEIYGRSPGMKALSDIKMINAMQKVIIQGAQKVVDPPIQMPDDGFLLPIRTAPGSINYFRAGSKDRMEPLITGARPDIGEAIMRDVEEKIRQAFFIDQLQLREADRMTATEVVQRRDEQLRRLGPILGRLHFELLRPMIDRVFGIMLRKKMFDPAPEILQDRDLNVEFVSQIAKAQKTAQLDDIPRTFNLIAPLIETNPSVVDNFDQDFILRDVTTKLGLPVDYLLTKTEVGQLRQQKAQMLAQQQQQEQLQENAGAVGELGG